VREHINAVQAVSETWSPERLLRWAFDTYKQEVAISSAFGAEGMALIDMASRVRPSFRLFTLDTEFLFPETYDLIERVERRYEIKVERVYSTLTPEDQEQLHGAALWKRDPDQCCNLRKIEPLRGKLAELQAWITAIRRNQTPDRAHAQKVEWDSKFQLVKINPLADWTSEAIWQYVRKHDVPYNPLHDRNYPSLGCTHCTRAIHAGEDPRAGRWADFRKTECGLHSPESGSTAPLIRIGAQPETEGNLRPRTSVSAPSS
jgi:phosphoadenosine phosphosulfate reductase